MKKLSVFLLCMFVTVSSGVCNASCVDTLLDVCMTAISLGEYCYAVGEHTSSEDDCYKAAAFTTAILTTQHDITLPIAQYTCYRWCILGVKRLPLPSVRVWVKKCLRCRAIPSCMSRSD